MNAVRATIASVAAAMLAGGCASVSEKGTLAELANVKPDTDEVILEDSLERAAVSYRRYLEETSESELTPEAMRRLADLTIEREYGIIGSGGIEEMAAPERSTPAAADSGARKPATAATPSETDTQFETRASARETMLAEGPELDALLPPGVASSAPDGPREAIETYRNILANYPDYERNDQVLYQMSRAWDELGQPDEAMAVMDQLIARYPQSKYLDEVHFRRGEYYFVRKRYLAAEEAYGSVIELGSGTTYFELALYKLGWSLYKQELYEEALTNYLAMLDHRLAAGYDFDQLDEQSEEHRIADTFRVISLSFSNLGGPEVIDEYFARHGARSYADKLYGNLGEFYFSKLRYDDAASVYKSFIEINPFHRVAPHFGMRVIEIYGEAGFPQLVVESKKAFARRYALDAEYWAHFAVEDSADVVEFLKINLTDLANHYHALYQDEALSDERPASFAEARAWYGQFLTSFPTASESPGINYQLADLLLENSDYREAAGEYERTAYEYGDHGKAGAAGYAAVYAWREALAATSGADSLAVRELTVTSSLRFADAFVGHEQAPVVLGAAADDLYDMQHFARAIDAAETFIERYPLADNELVRSAWAVVAHSSIDLADYPYAEQAYGEVLARTAPDDENRPAVVDGLAASIYKQAEAANLIEDYRAAAGHFLRIRDAAPTSEIRKAAEYDAAAALTKLEDWAGASDVLERFRSDFPEHELNREATQQLAFIYREDGQLERSAAEHERMAAEADEPELGREALLAAGALYDEARQRRRHGARLLAVCRRVSAPARYRH